MLHCFESLFCYQLLFCICNLYNFLPYSANILLNILLSAFGITILLKILLAQIWPDPMDLVFYSDSSRFCYCVMQCCFIESFFRFIILMQCYKGSQNYTEIFLTPPSPSNGTSSGRSTTTLVYEARVRSCATCMVNGRKEQLWSPYSNSAVCRWEEAAKKVESPEAELSSDKTQEVSSKGFFSGWSAGVLVFILVTLLTVVLAIGLGQVIVV